MQFVVVTIMPDLVTSSFQDGLIGQAIKKGLIGLETFNPRKFSEGPHHSIDDRVFGGGDGMLMQAEPLARAVDEIRTRFPESRVVHLSPRGRVLTDAVASEIAKTSKPLILISSRYAGVDQRFIDAYCDDEISIGDYVLSGGELPACVLIDAVSRKLPGVLGNEKSSSDDSFSDGLLESDQFTRPREWRGMDVPQVLLCGDPKLIEDWRFLNSVQMTLENRPDLLTSNLRPKIEEKRASFKKGLAASSQQEVRHSVYADLLKVAEELLIKLPMKLPK